MPKRLPPHLIPRGGPDGPQPIIEPTNRGTILTIIKVTPILISSLGRFYAGGGEWRVVVLLLAIGCLVGIPGIMAWGRSAGRVFHVGPALLIPAVILWTVLSLYTCGHCEKDLRRKVPFFVAMASAVLWHIALIQHNSDRGFHIFYALLFLPLFYFFCMLALPLAINFQL